MATGLPTRDGPGGRGAWARIVQAALVLFREQGVNATGVAQLASAAQVSKRTLYQYFPHKDDVVLAYLRELDLRPELTPEGALRNRELTPRARLLELFRALADQPPALRGCPFLAAAVELPDPRHPARRFIADHKRRFTEELTELARTAGASPAEPLAAQLALLYDGAAIQCLASSGPEPAHRAFALAAGLVDAAI